MVRVAAPTDPHAGRSVYPSSASSSGLRLAHARTRLIACWEGPQIADCAHASGQLIEIIRAAVSPTDSKERRRRPLRRTAAMRGAEDSLRLPRAANRSFLCSPDGARSTRATCAKGRSTPALALAHERLTANRLRRCPTLRPRSIMQAMASSCEGTLDAAVIGRGAGWGDRGAARGDQPSARKDSYACAEVRPSGGLTDPRPPPLGSRTKLDLPVAWARRGPCALELPGGVVGLLLPSQSAWQRSICRGYRRVSAGLCRGSTAGTAFPATDGMPFARSAKPALMLQSTTSPLVVTRVTREPSMSSDGTPRCARQRSATG